MTDVKRVLGKYLTMTPSEVVDGCSYEISKKEKEGLTNDDIGRLLGKRGVVIVDENHTERSQDIVERLKYELLNFYGIKSEERQQLFLMRVLQTVL